MSRMTTPSIPALLEPIQARLDAAEGRVHNPMFGDVLRIVWTTYYFGADLKWHNARSGEVENSRALLAEMEAAEGDWEWLIPGNGADTARLLAAVKAVDSILSQALTMISADPDVSEYERGFDDSTRGLSAKLRSAVEAELRGEA